MSDDKVRNPHVKERANRMPPDARRQQLTQCAIRVFARYGLGNAGHAQVADEAGVSTPTVFSYMPNRQALIDCVLVDVGQFLGAMVRDAAASASTAPRKLLAVTHAFVDTIDSHPDHVKVFLNWGAVLNEETWPQYADFQDQILAALQSIIEEGIASGEIPPGVNPTWGAHVVMGSANMIAQMKFRGREPAEITSFLNTLIRGALSGHS